MNISCISIENKLKYFNLSKYIKSDKINIKENLISIKTDSEIIIQFKFNKKITKFESKSFDNLMETLKKMAFDLSKIAKEKGRKKITVVFDDPETALKIISFEKGKYFKQYLSTINMIMLTDEILYKNDKNATHYIIKPKVTDYTIKTKIEYYKPRIISLKITNKIIHNAYVREESISS